MNIKHTFYILLMVVTSFLTTHIGADGSLRVFVNGLLSRRFADVALESVIDEIEPLKADKEISAPLTAGYACSSARVIRIIELSTNGECAQCLRLEFEPVANTPHFILTTIAFDYETATRNEADVIVKTLLRGAGVPQPSVDIRSDRSARFSDSWTVTNEMRSVSVNIERRRKHWHIWFTHRRDDVPGVPATVR